MLVGIQTEDRPRTSKRRLRHSISTSNSLALTHPAYCSMGNTQAARRIAAVIRWPAQRGVRGRTPPASRSCSIWITAENLEVVTEASTKSGDDAPASRTSADLGATTKVPECVSIRDCTTSWTRHQEASAAASTMVCKVLPSSSRATGVQTVCLRPRRDQGPRTASSC